MKEKFLCYCPKCGEESISARDRDCYYINVRDGFGRPLRHYRCRCGNIFAAFVALPIGWSSEDIEYFKGVIEGYNEGGVYYNEEFDKSVRTVYRESKDRDEEEFWNC